MSSKEQEMEFAHVFIWWKLALHVTLIVIVRVEGVDTMTMRLIMIMQTMMITMAMNNGVNDDGDDDNNENDDDDDTDATGQLLISSSHSTKFTKAF